MNDPFAKSAQSLTDALLLLDYTISLAESNVAAALQVGLPEAQDLAGRLPALTLRARQFLASIPSAGQQARWGETRRLLEQAQSFQPLFAPYLQLGNRVTAARQAIADRVTREKAAAEQVQRAQQTFECNAMLETARRRYSALRQVLADMQMQRGPGFDDAAWQSALRSLSSIFATQDVRLASAAASVRDRAFDDARAALDQSLGELQGALDLAQRTRASANARAQASLSTNLSNSTSAPLAAPNIGETQPIVLPLGQQSQPQSSVSASSPTAQKSQSSSQSESLSSQPAPHAIALVPPAFRLISLIEVRNGTIFRCNGSPTLIGRGLDAPTGQPYINLSQACDPGEAEDLGISRRHAELGRQGDGFAIKDLDSTNGTRVRRTGQQAWTTLQPQSWFQLQEGDSLQFGLLVCSVSFTR
jgi:hypothetical protein